MNILPKKSWHVRTRKNIERVRRDEAQAAEEEKEVERRKALAESEARTELLRTQSRKRLHEDDDNDKQLVVTSGGHINFFQDEEAGLKKTGTNAEYEQEKREEKEKQEKAIGLLTYLGQSAVESQSEKPWYFKPPEKRRKLNEAEPSTSDCKLRKKEEFDLKHKWHQDPMKMMMTYISTRDKVIERDKANVSHNKSHHVPALTHQLQTIPTAREVSESHGIQGTPIISSTRRDVLVSHREDAVRKRKLRRKDRKKKKKERKKEKKSNKHKKKKKRKEKDFCESSVERHQEEVANLSTVIAQPVSASSRTLQELRAERLRREQEERLKTEQLLSKLRGDPPKEEEAPNERDTRYNSQFNPELIRRKKKKNFQGLDLDKL